MYIIDSTELVHRASLIRLKKLNYFKLLFGLLQFSCCAPNNDFVRIFEFSEIKTVLTQNWKFWKKIFGFASAYVTLRSRPKLEKSFSQKSIITNASVLLHLSHYVTSSGIIRVYTNAHAANQSAKCMKFDKWDTKVTKSRAQWAILNKQNKSLDTAALKIHLHHHRSWKIRSTKTRHCRPLPDKSFKGMPAYLTLACTIKTQNSISEQTKKGGWKCWD